ncbi:hypothetical protein N657DRAFT_636814 [Parathielavia appendiculata]|uniref:Uncharacterized protein n=1 Tax=Parathielavia appendiculata TaxID=2587402 RepID=A0AAN6TSX0_9PEZI|nr:hypothetical protein N657DRAFT_636814 [Parathielavia appendiculata]
MEPVDLGHHDNFLLNDDIKRSTADFHKHIFDNVAIYSKYRVTALTHLKDLGSIFSHEYLFFTAHHTETGQPVRFLAERDVAKDVVIVGPLVTRKLGSSTKPLPLPLRILTFDTSAATRERPSLFQVAAVLKRTSAAGGTYKPGFKDCFWFARVVYSAFHERYKTTSTHTTVNSVSPGRLTRWIYPQLFKGRMLVSSPSTSPDVRTNDAG